MATTPSHPQFLDHTHSTFDIPPEFSYLSGQTRFVTFLCIIFNGVLFGVLCGQVGYYLKRYYHRDRRSLKCMVAVVLALNAFHFACFMSTTYQTLSAELSCSKWKLPWSAQGQLLANTLSILAVHGFYLSRIWTIGKQPLLISSLIALVMTPVALSIVILVNTLHADSSVVLAHIATLEIVLSAVLAAADTSLATIFAISLFRSRRGGARRSYRLVKGLAFYTVATGILTCVCALFALLAVVIAPHSVIYATFYLMGSNLYGNACLLNLNARESLRARLIEVSEFPTIPVTSLGQIPTETTPIRTEDRCRCLYPHHHRH